MTTNAVYYNFLCHNCDFLSHNLYFFMAILFMVAGTF